MVSKQSRCDRDHVRKPQRRRDTEKLEREFKGRRGDSDRFAATHRAARRIDRSCVLCASVVEPAAFEYGIRLILQAILTIVVRAPNHRGMAALLLSLGRAEDPLDDAMTAIATFPTIVGTYGRLSSGEAPVAVRADLTHAAHYLHQFFGAEPSADRARAMETYLNTVCDHGLNASTFAARVIVSTHSDVISAITGAVGALKGPLHGGAPAPALDMVLEIGTPERAEAVIRAKLERGERLMGFGHRIYRVRDPRADVLAQAADRFYASGGDPR